MNHAKSVSVWGVVALLGGFLAVAGCVSSKLVVLGPPVKATGTISLDVDDDFKVTKLILIGDDEKPPVDYEIWMDDKSDQLTCMFGAKVQITGKMGKQKGRAFLVVDSFTVQDP